MRACVRACVCACVCVFTLKANSLYVYRYQPDSAIVVASLVAVMPLAVVAASQAACRRARVCANRSGKRGGACAAG